MLNRLPWYYLNCHHDTTHGRLNSTPFCSGPRLTDTPTSSALSSMMSIMTEPKNTGWHWRHWKGRMRLYTTSEAHAPWISLVIHTVNIYLLFLYVLNLLTNQSQFKIGSWISQESRVRVLNDPLLWYQSRLINAVPYRNLCLNYQMTIVAGILGA